MKEGESNKEHLGDLFNHPAPDSPAVHDGDDSFSQSQCQGKQLYAIWNENGPSWSWGTAHFPGVDNIHENYRGRKETLRYLVDYSSLFLSEVSWMAAVQVLRQEQSCSVDIWKKYIPVTWTYSPTGFCWDLSADYLITPAEENTSLPNHVAKEHSWHDDQDWAVTEGRKLIAELRGEHTG